jgi:hypothetical protein
MRLAVPGFAALRQALSRPLRHDFPPHLVYHYTTRAGLEGLLTERAIRATHFRHLNDKLEFEYGDNLVFGVAARMRTATELSAVQRDIRERFFGLHRDMYFSRLMDVYVACFTSLPDAPRQWQEYGDGGAGYAIGIEIREGKDVPGAPPTHLGAAVRKLEYDRSVSESTVQAALSELFATLEQHLANPILSAEARGALFDAGMGVIFQEVGPLVMRIKRAEYRAEREWRIIAMPNGDARDGLVKKRTTRGTEVPYVNFPLVVMPHDLLDVKSVCVGPRQDPVAGVRATQLLLEGLGYDPKVVKCSKGRL